MATPDRVTPAGPPESALASSVVAPADPIALLLPPPPVPEAGLTRRQARWINRLDRVLIAVVLLFAFLSASFAARNSDLWMHLAAGRLLAHGGYQFGVDPFAYTTQGIYWIHHAWLFDLVLYALYASFGGAVLVLLKALLVTALAWLMLQVRRSDQGLGLPVVCTTLALAAIGLRLFLQPVCLSYLFLGLTLVILFRQQTEDGGTRRRLGILLFVFVVWVNVDSWFLLGPFVTVLFWLGERLSGTARRTPGWLIPASLGVCLLNPHHVFAFALPPELSPILWSTGLEQDSRFQRGFSSAWPLLLALRSSAGWNLAVVAYFLLLLLGLASFASQRAARTDWRILVWGTFALLGAWQVRAIPFFAVVAGPITTLNGQDYLARRAVAATVRRGRGLILGRVALLLAGLALLITTWFGWVPGPHEGRRLGWAVQADPSLQRAAETLRDWRERGFLHKGEQVFGLHPDVAHYCAWFCPEVKGFLDHRFPLFPEAAREFEAVCHDLSPALTGGDSRTAERGSRSGWQQVFRDHSVACLVVYDPDERRLFPVLNRLTRDPAHWTLLRIDGQAVLFGWNEARPGSRDPFARLRFDPDHLAFGSPGVGGTMALPPAPGQGPPPGPQAATFWRLLQPPPPPAWESPAATMYLRQFEDRTETDTNASRDRSWAVFAAGLAVRRAQSGSLLAGAVEIVFRLSYPGVFLGDPDARSPALPLLAVRAARRAVAANPRDPAAYLRLGQAYLNLRLLTRERTYEPRLPPLEMLRYVQIVTALEQAVLLKRDLVAAHEALAFLYGERQYLDTALEHRRIQLELTRRARPLGREEAEAFTRRLEQLDQSVQALERQVQDRQAQFVVRARPLGADPLARARLALGLGLPRQALDVLLQSQVLLFGPPGARLELELLLMLGRIDELREKLGDEEVKENRVRLGSIDPEILQPTPESQTWPSRLSAYEWLVVCQAVASGNYDEAEAALAERRDGLQHECRRNFQLQRLALPLTLATEVGLHTGPDRLLVPILLRQYRDPLANWVIRTYALQVEQASLAAVGGMLALERGLPAEAEGLFQYAVDLCRPSGGLAEDCAARPLALDFLQRLRAHQ
jgi:hypothetical protein